MARVADGSGDQNRAQRMTSLWNRSMSPRSMSKIARSVITAGWGPSSILAQASGTRPVAALTSSWTTRCGCRGCS
eukprot:3583082-Alexandrium_andersonii.AAC.1